MGSIPLKVVLVYTQSVHQITDITFSHILLNSKLPLKSYLQQPPLKFGTCKREANFTLQTRETIFEKWTESRTSTSLGLTWEGQDSSCLSPSFASCWGRCCRMYSYVVNLFHTGRKERAVSAGKATP